MYNYVIFVLYLIEDVWLQLFVGGLVGVLVYIAVCRFFNVINDDMLMMIKIKKRV